MILLQEDFATVLLCEGHCSSLEEAVVLSELILNDFLETDDNAPMQMMATVLQNYLGLEENQAHILTSKLILEDATGTGSEDGSVGDHSSEQEMSDILDSEEDDIPLFDGECELCDRYIRLTKHHLIPKSTWSRMESRLKQAADAKQKGHVKRATLLLGPGLEHVLDRLESRKNSVRSIMSKTCNICRPCHSAVHRTHDNMTLALSYNTVDQLLLDDRIVRFCKWASKQRPGKYAVS
eukprot:scaffold22583_cov106-Cylindrotheca_fusiformis.AAC.8